MAVSQPTFFFFVQFWLNVNVKMEVVFQTPGDLALITVIVFLASLETSVRRTLTSAKVTLATEVMVLILYWSFWSHFNKKDIKQHYNRMTELTLTLFSFAVLFSFKIAGYVPHHPNRWKVLKNESFASFDTYFLVYEIIEFFDLKVSW